MSTDCIRLNKLAQVKLSSATLKTNICGTQTPTLSSSTTSTPRLSQPTTYNIDTKSINTEKYHLSTRLHFLAWWRSYFCFYFLSWSFAFCAQLVIYHQKLDITCLNLQILKRKKIDLDVGIMETQVINIYNQIIIY